MVAPYVPEEQRDSRYYIWFELFQCRIPNKQTMSVDYIRHFGMPSVGDDRYDKEMANELIDRMLTIDDMVEFFKQGVKVRIVHDKDIPVIYQHISKHLQLWKNELQITLTPEDAPVDDLIDLDRFANAVYAHAKYQFTREMASSLLAERVQTLSRRTLAFKKKTISLNDTSKDKEKKHPDRESMANAFRIYKTPVKRKF